MATFIAPPSEQYYDIFERIRRGEIDPATGEGEAAAKGGTLNPLPAVDPLEEQLWQLITVIAWIAWRRREDVRWLWGPFRRQAQHWVKCTETIVRADGNKSRTAGRQLRQIDPPEPSLAILEMAALGGDIGTTLRPADIDAAESELWAALSDGRLTASAIDPVTRKPRFLDPLECRYLELEDGIDELAGEVVLRTTHASQRQALRLAVVKVSDVLRLWPAGGAETGVADTPGNHPHRKKGRRPSVVWALIRPLVLKKLDDEGAPSDMSDDPDWRFQADLEKFIRDLYRDRTGAEPSVSRARAYASKWLTEFEDNRRQQGQ